MQHLFVPYELALLAKEKGFDEPCLAWHQKSEILNHVDEMVMYMVGQPNNYQIYTTHDWDEVASNVNAPLYQQLNDWFRETHNLNIQIKINDWNKYFCEITNVKGSFFHSAHYAEEDYYTALTKAFKEAFKLI